MYKRAKLGIGYLPQEASVFRKLTVEDNIRSVLELTDFSKEYQKEKLEQLIKEFNLAHVRKNLGDRLSGVNDAVRRLRDAWRLNPSS